MDSSEKNEDELKLDSAWAEYMRRCDEGEKLDRQAFASQFPEIAEQLLGLLEAADALEKMAGPNGSLTSLMSVVRSPVPTPPVDDPLKESTLPVHFDAKLIDEPQGSMDITVGGRCPQTTRSRFNECADRTVCRYDGTEVAHAVWRIHT